MAGYWDVTFQFSYFDIQLGNPDWELMRILDFGGSIGNILPMSQGRIHPENYWCMDVNAAAVLEGQRLHPSAHFLHHNHYNFSFDPKGIPELPIQDPGQRFDLIVAHSVFTHTSPSELVGTVNELLGLLAPGGRLAFTFIEAEYNAAKTNPGYRDITNLELRLRQLNGRPRPNLQAEYFRIDPEWSILLNEDDFYFENEALRSYNPKDKDTYFSFFKPGYVQSLFPEAKILLPPARVYAPDYIAEQQHVCIVRKG